MDCPISQAAHLYLLIKEDTFTGKILRSPRKRETWECVGCGHTYEVIGGSSHDVVEAGK